MEDWGKYLLGLGVPDFSVFMGHLGSRRRNVLYFSACFGILLVFIQCHV